GILQLHCCRRGFDDKFERFIRINSNKNGKYLSYFVLSPGVELFTEFHDIDTLGTQCRTNWRCGVGLATLALKLYIASDFFCHFVRFIGSSDVWTAFLQLLSSPKFVKFRFYGDLKNFL